MNPLKTIKEKYNHSYISKWLKSFRNKSEGLTQSEFVNLINARLPEDKNITQAHLSYYVNGIKSPSPEVRGLMIKIMGEEAGAVYPWEGLVVDPLRKEVRELQDTVLHLSPGAFSFSWRRMACKAVRYAIIATAVLSWTFIYLYSDAVIEGVADRLFKSYEERIAERDDVIIEFKDIIESKDKRFKALLIKYDKLIESLVEKGEAVKDVEEKKRKAK